MRGLFALQGHLTLLKYDEFVGSRLNSGSEPEYIPDMRLIEPLLFGGYVIQE